MTAAARGADLAPIPRSSATDGSTAESRPLLTAERLPGGGEVAAGCGGGGGGRDGGGG